MTKRTAKAVLLSFGKQTVVFLCNVVLDKIQKSFEREAVEYSRHARTEMRGEPLGRISESDVKESVRSGLVIKEYPDDTPYPSILIFDFTRNRRPIHVVAAHEP